MAEENFDRRMVEEVIKDFLKHMYNVTYKNPLMDFYIGSMVTLAGKTIALGTEMVEELKELIEKAKKSGKINNKELKGIYKAIAETQGPLHTLAIDLSAEDPYVAHPWEKAITKKLTGTTTSAWKGVHRNMVDTGNSEHFELKTNMPSAWTEGNTKRLPGGPSAFTPAYMDTLMAAVLVDAGVAMFIPFVEVTNKDITNISQSDLYTDALNAYANKDIKGLEQPNINIANLTGEIIKLQPQLDFPVLDFVFADPKLLEQYAREDLLDPRVIDNINA